MSARMWARPLRESPPTELKLPPTYQPPAPSETTANTPGSSDGADAPENLGDAGSTSPVEADSAAQVPVAGPTWVKLPPR
jgi:hypothetical protein